MGIWYLINMYVAKYILGISSKTFIIYQLGISFIDFQE